MAFAAKFGRGGRGGRHDARHDARQHSCRLRAKRALEAFAHQGDPDSLFLILGILALFVIGTEYLAS
jgi:hypothetical protein